MENKTNTTQAVAPRGHNYQHGHTTGNKPTPEYRCWMSMLQRCYYPKAKGYARYGGAGINLFSAPQSSNPTKS